MFKDGFLDPWRYKKHPSLLVQVGWALGEDGTAQLPASLVLSVRVEVHEDPGLRVSNVHLGKPSSAPHQAESTFGLSNSRSNPSKVRNLLQRDAQPGGTR